MIVGPPSLFTSARLLPATSPLTLANFFCPFAPDPGRRGLEPGRPRRVEELLEEIE